MKLVEEVEVLRFKELQVREVYMPEMELQVQAIGGGGSGPVISNWNACAGDHRIGNAPENGGKTVNGSYYLATTGWGTGGTNLRGGGCLIVYGNNI